MRKKQQSFFFSFIAIILTFSRSLSATVAEPSNNSLFILLNAIMALKDLKKKINAGMMTLRTIFKARLLDLKAMCIALLMICPRCLQLHMQMNWPSQTKIF